MAIDPLLTPEEVSTWLGVPIATLYQWRYWRNGPPSLKVGRHLRYRADDIERWIDEQTQDSRRSVIDDTGGGGSSA